MSEIKNRPDWLQERNKGIGASDAAAILGLSPYKSNVQLWAEKTGRKTPVDISDKPYVAYGNNAEKHLRGLFKIDYPEYKTSYKPYDLVINPQYPFILATLDGRLIDHNKRRGVLEIKTTEIMKSSQWIKWDQQIPQNYYVQVLHQMIAYEAEFSALKAQLKFKDKNDNKAITTRHYFYEREFIANDLQYLLDAEIKFWSYVESDKEPPLVLPSR